MFRVHIVGVKGTKVDPRTVFRKETEEEVGRLFVAFSVRLINPIVKTDWPSILNLMGDSSDPTWQV